MKYRQGFMARMQSPKLNTTPKIAFASSQIEFTSDRFVVIAGPCSIESQAHLLQTAQGVKLAGAQILRGGIFKMRTQLESFQGLGASAYAFIQDSKKQVGMPLVSEVTDPRQIEEMLEFVDMFQVGSRNMYNYALLKELSLTGKPVLLKRGFSATVDEWLKAAEYVTAEGLSQVVLCERGIRTFETSTRNTIDLNSVAYIKAHTDYKVIVDPSHGTGRPELIAPLTLAAAAVGADGVMIEVHPQPSQALSDGHQALNIEQFQNLMLQLQPVLNAVNKKMATVKDAAHTAANNVIEQLPRTLIEQNLGAQ